MESTIIPLRRSALISGWGLLLMTFFAVYPYYFIFPDLIIADDVATTASSIAANGFLFRIAICCYLIVIVLDVLVAWGLYIFLKPTNTHISVLAAWFRLVYSAIFAVALGYYFEVLRLLSTSDYLLPLNKEELYTQLMLALESFNDMWAIGYIFFGLHLFILGYLVFKSSYNPKILGVLLMIVGLSYLIDYMARFLFPENSLPVSTYFGWGELVFMLWLLFIGGKMQSKI